MPTFSKQTNPSGIILMTRSDVASEKFQFCEIYTAQDASAVIEGDAGTDKTDCLTEAIPKNLSDIKSEQSPIFN